jgi:hypothetical protein
MITLVRASALTATAFTAAVVVVTLRMPAHGGSATVPVYVAPAASQTTGQGPGNRLRGRPYRVRGTATASGRQTCAQRASRVPRCPGRADARPAPSGLGPGGHDGVVAFKAASGRWSSDRRAGSGCAPP